MRQQWRLACSLLLIAATTLVLPLQAAAGLDNQAGPPPTSTPAPPSSPDTAAPSGLAALLLTEAEVASNLHVYNRTAAARTEAGLLPSYSVTFLADSLPETAVPGTMVSVHNVVTQGANLAPSLDRLMDDLREDWGRTRELPPPAVGEESRAVVTDPPPDASGRLVSTVGIVFRRQETLVGVAVSALGQSPPLDEAIRLARLVDSRLAAAAAAGQASLGLADRGDPAARPVRSQGPVGEGQYAANYAANRILIVDQVNKTLVTVAPTGNEPFLLAANHDGSRMYLVNRPDDLLSVIDTVTYDLVASVLIGRPRVALATNRDETRLFIGGFFRDAVLIVDNTARSVLATVEVKGLVGDIASDAAGRRIYAGSLEDDAQGRRLVLSVIDTDSLAVSATVRLGRAELSGGGAAGVAINPAGTRVYVANGFANTVSVIDTSTNALVATVPAGLGPDRMLFSPDGSRLFVANAFSSTVSVVDAVDNTVVETLPIGGANSGEGIAGDPNRSPGLWITGREDRLQVAGR
jgi:YVTN family beta-propeller protein